MAKILLDVYEKTKDKIKEEAKKKDMTIKAFILAALRIKDKAS